MIVALVALVLLNVATMIVAARREARLLDALMARNAGEYALIRRSDSAPKGKGAKQAEVEPATGWMVGA